MSDPGSPIYDQLALEHWLPDAQSRAYREMGPVDVVTDDELGSLPARRHPPLPPGADPADHLLLPDDYEREGWDAGREDLR